MALVINRDPDTLQASGFSRNHARVCVFKRQGVMGQNRKPSARQPIDRWVWFAGLHIVGSDDFVEVVPQFQLLES